MNGAATETYSIRETGVPWIGAVPATWQIRRVKYAAYVKGRVGWHALSTGEFTSEGPHLVTGTDFEDGRVRWDRCHRVSEARFNQDPYIQLRSGDLLITKDGTIGKLALVEDEMPPQATLNSGIFVTRPLRGEYDSRFFYWVLASRIFSTFVDLTKVGSTINHLYQKELGEFSFPAPPLCTQRTIADFLDRKTRAVDQLIRKKDRLIELLHEKRQAIITRAVTKGIDPNVPMKDSGVPWLGEIPAHWEVKRLKHLTARIVDCPHSTPVYSEDGEFPAIRTADVGPGTVDMVSARRVTEQVYRERVERMTPRAGDILYSREGERFGMAALVPEGVRLCLAQRMMIFRVAPPNHPAFVMMSLNGEGAFQQVKQDTVGATSPRVNIPTIVNMVLAAPPRDEQIDIAHALDRLTQAGDCVRKRIEMQLDRLHEYRQALISAAVTGQIEVAERSAVETHHHLGQELAVP